MVSPYKFTKLSISNSTTTRNKRIENKFKLKYSNKKNLNS